nr:MAG TPA: hypothetical protein [Caudoviricetes sp.]
MLLCCETWKQRKGSHFWDPFYHLCSSEDG